MATTQRVKFNYIDVMQEIQWATPVGCIEFERREPHTFSNGTKVQQYEVVLEGKKTGSIGIGATEAAHIANMIIKDGIK